MWTILVAFSQLQILSWGMGTSVLKTKKKKTKNLAYVNPSVL